MITLFTDIEYLTANSLDKLPCNCEHCSGTFYTTKKLITQELTEKRNRVRFCSKPCFDSHQSTKTKVVCLNCNKTFEKQQSQVKKTKNNFCSRSCAVTYNNKHKTHGNRRSKLEKYLEEQLTILYPNLDIHYNQKSAISSELDIYIPSLNLAFELNGIFHYEPIYGTNKLNQIQENDVSKSKACHDAKIDLCVIDTSQQIYVKPSTSQKYLDIIRAIIELRY